MTDYYKVYLVNIVLMLISLMLSCIDWKVTGNMFLLISIWVMFFITGLISGRTLTLKEVEK